VDVLIPGLDTVYEWRVELDCGRVSKGGEASVHMGHVIAGRQD
jgi:hypothetical protein